RHLEQRVDACLRGGFVVGLDEVQHVAQRVLQRHADGSRTRRPGADYRDLRTHPAEQQLVEVDAGHARNHLVEVVDTQLWFGSGDLAQPSPPAGYVESGYLVAQRSGRYEGNGVVGDP